MNNINWARRPATKEDMIKDIDILIKVWKEYKKLYKRELAKRGGLFSVDMINKSIIKAKKNVGTKEEHEVSVEGFFDSYVSMMTVICDSAIVHNNIDKQLRDLKEESMNNA